MSEEFDLEDPSSESPPKTEDPPEQTASQTQPPASNKSGQMENPSGEPADPEEKKPDGFETSQEKYDKMNREQLILISEDQSFFTARGQYSFLINAFAQEEKALEYIQRLKKKFPLWSFLIKAKKQKLKIYLGPFDTEKSAGEFIKTLPEPSPFPGYFLEKMPL